MNATVAVIDVGKTDVRLSAATTDGVIAETLATPNRSLSGPPYRHYDLDGMEAWLLDGLAELDRRHPIAPIDALRLAIEVEALARMYVQALTLGEPPILGEEEMARVIEQMRRMSYGLPPDGDGVNDTPQSSAGAKAN